MNESDVVPDPNSGTTSGELSVRTFWIVVLLAALVAAVPILATPILPFLDYPNHLARIAILRDLNGPLGTYFQANARLLPNLGMDAVMFLLASVLPIERAGQISVALVAVLFVTGFARLHVAVHGKRTAWALVGALALYTLPLLFGFLNFVLGVSLAMHVLATRARTDPWPGRAVFGVLAGFVLLISHLLGLVFVVLLEPVFDRLAGRSWKSSLKGLLVYIPALVAYVLFSPRPADGSTIDRSTLALKKIHLMSTFITGHTKLDAAFVALAILGIAALLATGWGSIRPKLLLPGGIFVALWLVLPFGIGGTANLDARFPAIAILFGLLAFGPGRVAFPKAVVAVLGAVILFRSVTLAASYRKDGAKIAALRAEIAAMPPGAIVVPIRHEDALVWDAFNWRPPLVYAAHLATLEGHFVAGTFDEPTQQPIVLRGGWETIGDYRATRDLPAALAELRRDVAALARKPGPVWVYTIEPAEAPGQPPRPRLFPLDAR